jgi:hypothetical protein
MEWLGLILALSVLVGSLPAVIDQYRRDRAGFWKTLRLFGVYLVFIFANIGVMLWLLSGPAPSLPRAFAAGLFGIAAIFYAGFWLTRIVPRYRELPAWVDRYPSGIDYAFWAILAGALVVALVT